MGFPRCGKTTLITALFAYMFRDGVRGASIVPRGEETIQRVNENLEQLELGRSVKPTTDQDVFAYRAEVITKSILLSSRYKLEIGDFPGEDTVKFTEQYGNWLHRTTYFEWAVEADAFVFVVDMRQAMGDSSGAYVAGQKRAFRAAWQRLQEKHLDGASNLASKPLILVFSKCDAFVKNMESFSKDRVYPVEFVELTPNIQHNLKEIELVVLEKFSDLISYFERENRRFRTLFTSVYLNVHGDRKGIPELARFIMP